MKHAFVTAVLAASLLAPAMVALAQPVVDLRTPRPRDVASTVFTVTGTQDFRVDAIGAESASNRSTFSWIAALTKIGDDESRTRAFTLAQAADVRVYALGEGSAGRMFDYGWITRASTGEKVWEMRFAETDHAGGDAKNRQVDRTIRLEKGDYVLHYVSDDSHAYHEWNASAPRDVAHWGITLLSAGGTATRGRDR